MVCITAIMQAIMYVGGDLNCDKPTTDKNEKSQPQSTRHKTADNYVLDTTMLMSINGTKLLTLSIDNIH